jgi:hypothetical protein
MITRYANYFLKSRIIPLSFWADKMAMEVIKEPFEEYRNYFVEEDPRKYFVRSIAYVGMRVLFTSRKEVHPLHIRQ